MPSYAQILMSVITDCFDNADIFSLGKILFFTRYNRLLRCWLVQKLLVSEIRSTKKYMLTSENIGYLAFQFYLWTFLLFILQDVFRSFFSVCEYLLWLSLLLSPNPLDILTIVFLFHNHTYFQIFFRVYHVSAVCIFFVHFSVLFLLVAQYRAQLTFKEHHDGSSVMVFI